MALGTSDWVLIGTTIALAIVAIFGPAFADRFKSWFLSPDLTLTASTAPPDSHQTSLAFRISASQVEKHPCYYYRLKITNRGRTQARRCEVLIERLDIADAAGRFIPYENYTPVRLRWDAKAPDFADINPDRSFFCNFLTIPHAQVQFYNSAAGTYVDLKNSPSPDVGLVLEVESVLYVQPSRIPAGRYRFHLAVYAENAPTSRHVVEVNWSGRWQDDQAEMFRQCVMEARAAS